MNVELKNVLVIEMKDIDKIVVVSFVLFNFLVKRRLIVNRVLCRKYERIVGYDKFNSCLIFC